MRVEPSPPLLVCALIAFDCAGSCLQDVADRGAAGGVEQPRGSGCVSGAGVVSVLRSIVEPVTVMTSSLDSCSASLANSASLRSAP